MAELPAEALAEQAEKTVVARLLPLVGGVAVERRELRRGGDIALEPAFRQPQSRRLHVEIGVRDALFQRGQLAVAEDRPPIRDQAAQTQQNARRCVCVGSCPAVAKNEVCGKPGFGGTKSGPTEQPASSAAEQGD